MRDLNYRGKRQELAQPESVRSIQIMKPTLTSRRVPSLWSRVAAAFGLVMVCIFLPLQAAEPAGAIPTERMMQDAPETETLRQRCGEWDVTCTIWPAPGAEPLITTGLRVQRTMVGLYMAEVMKPAPESGTPEFTRLAYLTYSRVEGRWQYVSMDTRLPVGIMPAYSFGKGSSDGTLTLIFEPIAFAGVGKTVEGHMMRSNLVITRDGNDHEFSRQHFIRSDGSEQEWLAVQYEYRRRK